MSEGMLLFPVNESYCKAETLGNLKALFLLSQVALFEGKDPEAKQYLSTKAYKLIFFVIDLEKKLPELWSIQKQKKHLIFA